MTDRSDHGTRVWRVISAAATDVTNLVVVGSSAISAAIAGSWGFLMVGATIYTVLVALKSLSPSHWQRVIGAEQQAQCLLPRTETLIFGESRALVQRFADGRNTALQSLALVPESELEFVAFAKPMIEETERVATELVWRSELLAAFLSSANREQIADAVATLHSQAIRTTDARTREHLLQAADTRTRQLATLDEMLAAKKRVNAGFEHALAIIEILPGQIVKLRLMNEEERENALLALSREITELRMSADASEQAILSVARESETLLRLPLKSGE